MALPTFDALFDWTETLPPYVTTHPPVSYWSLGANGEPTNRTFPPPSTKQIPGSALAVVHSLRRVPPNPADIILFSIPELQSVSSSTHVTLTRGSWKKFHITSYYPAGNMISTAGDKIKRQTHQLLRGFQPFLEGECATWYRGKVVDGLLDCVRSAVRQQRPECPEFRTEQHLVAFLQLLNGLGA